MGLPVGKLALSLLYFGPIFTEKYGMRTVRFFFYFFPPFLSLFLSFANAYEVADVDRPQKVVSAVDIKKEILVCQKDIHDNNCDDLRVPNDPHSDIKSCSEEELHYGGKAALKCASSLTMVVPLWQSGVDYFEIIFGDFYKVAEGPEARAKLATSKRALVVDIFSKQNRFELPPSFLNRCRRDPLVAQEFVNQKIPKEISKFLYDATDKNNFNQQNRWMQKTVSELLGKVLSGGRSYSMAFENGEFKVRGKDIDCQMLADNVGEFREDMEKFALDAQKSLMQQSQRAIGKEKSTNEKTFADLKKIQQAANFKMASVQDLLIAAGMNPNQQSVLSQYLACVKPEKKLETLCDLASMLLPAGAIGVLSKAQLFSKLSKYIRNGRKLAVAEEAIGAEETAAIASVHRKASPYHNIEGYAQFREARIAAIAAEDLSGNEVVVAKKIEAIYEREAAQRNAFQKAQPSNLIPNAGARRTGEDALSDVIAVIDDAKGTTYPKAQTSFHKDVAERLIKRTGRTKDQLFKNGKFETIENHFIDENGKVMDITTMILLEKTKDGTILFKNIAASANEVKKMEAVAHACLAKAVLSKNMKEKIDYFSRAIRLYFNAMPYERGSAGIGEMVKSGIAKKVFGPNFRMTIADLDIEAMTRDLVDAPGVPGMQSLLRSMVP